MRMEYLGMSGVMFAVVSSEKKNAVGGKWAVPFFPRWVWVVGW
jgi:hypothetical protein